MEWNDDGMINAIVVELVEWLITHARLKHAEHFSNILVMQDGLPDQSQDEVFFDPNKTRVPWLKGWHSFQPAISTWYRETSNLHTIMSTMANSHSVAQRSVK